MSLALLPQDISLHLLRDMMRIRRLEERAGELYGEGKIRGFLHLYIGEEAVAVGVLHALAANDAVVATYREHGHALIKGVPMSAIMAEMYGRQEGCSRGRGGSMHLFDARTRFFGGNAIVAGGLPLTVGLALAERMQDGSRLCACFFGEGAMAEGAFHESINLAALWHLPVLFCCENNLYAMGTALDRSQSQTDLCSKALAYKVNARSVDGMDVIAVHEATRHAVEHIRAERGPFFLEFRTYRFRAHSMFDPQLYRDKAEVEQWRARDPIHTYSAWLKAKGLLDEPGFLAILAQVSAEVEAAVAYAENGSLELIEDLSRDLYTPGGAP
ncbi:pyruvate dehydrogenase (acetyl-transferring) E1 component subunit alpha [Pseudomonas chlororaphis]|uniref:pyruvate dehydrogenase (acetyl-transferring) E1 component subunit alpha n=1 Tax=Pseudomonas chlororaphis TaxID=587753 RepID=UPI0015DFD346|nr:pyruvate dehydrogenase (acetyl-transferring) E1 component subunit alpha [Pseudomonas chlororaphis]QLL10739.1 pyruvate dehydrogenase (acetyl-transferring) E1 component subunit alpha [Pseudomonas chlororaphis subsp. aurantiaca]